MANDVMIDMETLSTSPNCVILTIGAVRFDPRGEGVVERLELRPTIEEQTEQFNRHIDPDTVAWWGQQSEGAMEEALGDQGRISYRDALEQLRKFCWNRNAVWSNGATFDIVVAENAFRQVDIKTPWNFWAIRDTRTLFDIAKVKLSDGGHSTSHKAVEDCERQVAVVQMAYKKLMAVGLGLK